MLLEASRPLALPSLMPRSGKISLSPKSQQELHLPPTAASTFPHDPSWADTVLQA